ncbi:hypothetical protein GN109_10615 [Collimonas pratensis]|uniref:hypothetical protein n=1 Tax=Collimonas pratensis TaxID=279113 RepID=UPI00143D017C|nr:hypothetical protein [Collimonas pratensis]NKI69873.1 hypothetical protein [Collimonas pratensis]
MVRTDKKGNDSTSLLLYLYAFLCNQSQRKSNVHLRKKNTELVSERQAVNIDSLKIANFLQIKRIDFMTPPLGEARKGSARAIAAEPIDGDENPTR